MVIEETYDQMTANALSLERELAWFADVLALRRYITNSWMRWGPQSCFRS